MGPSCRPTPVCPPPLRPLHTGHQHARRRSDKVTQRIVDSNPHVVVRIRILKIPGVTTGRGLHSKAKISLKRHILGIMEARDLQNQIRFFPKNSYF